MSSKREDNKTNRHYLCFGWGGFGFFANMSNNNICRLCRGTEYLTSLIELETPESSIYFMISNCLDFEHVPGDGLPAMICATCLIIIREFYYFKQKCLKVYSELMEEVRMQAQNTNLYNYEDISSPEPEDLRRKPTQEYTTTLKVVFEDNIDKVGDNLYIDKIEYKTVQCEICGKMFSTKLQYRQHVASHKEPKMYQCKYCPKQFTRSETRANHTRSHLGIKPFVCDICGQLATKRQDLIRHMSVHTDEKKFGCQICGRRFKRSFDLRNHKRTHTGARPFKCDICGKDYTSHSGLRKHRKRHKDQCLDNDVDVSQNVMNHSFYTLNNDVPNNNVRPAISVPIPPPMVRV